MTEKTFMAGFGGQGVISLGQLWVYCGMKESKEVTFFPFYGAEKRGGIARASVIVSDSEIASPLVTTPDSAIVKQETTRKDARVIKVPCNEIAEQLGDVRFANMVMMGALSKATGAVKLDKLEAVLKSFFPESKHKFIPKNLEAIEAGMKVVK